MHCEMIIIINLVNIIITHSYKVFFLVMRTSKVYSLQFSHSVMSDSLRPHRLQHARLPCPSPTPELTQTHVLWVSDTIQLSHPLVPFSSHLQSFLASGSFQMNQFFASGSQSIGVSASASVLPRNIQDWFPLGWTGLISLQSKGLSRVFSNTTVQKFTGSTGAYSFSGRRSPSNESTLRPLWAHIARSSGQQHSRRAGTPTKRAWQWWGKASDC